MKRNAIVGRAWRLLADAKRTVARSGSARPALAALGEPKRSDAVAWTRVTSDAHAQYRADIEVPNETVAVVCVSRRPHLLNAVAANIRRQVGISPGLLEVVYVTNYDDVNTDEIKRAFEGISPLTLETTKADSSLGAALNCGLAAAESRFVAKFDDDDLYGPHYLADALRAHSYCGAGVVGKHTYYAGFHANDQTVLRFPGHEFSYSATLAGGTLVIDRGIVGGLQFQDISLGEDRAFLASCHRHGISTFSADRFNFTQIRSSDNTWQPGASFLLGTMDVDIKSTEHCVNR